MHSIESRASRARVECESSARECELVGGRHCKLCLSRPVARGGSGGSNEPPSEDKGPALRLRGSTTVPPCRQLSKADLGD